MCTLEVSIPIRSSTYIAIAALLSTLNALGGTYYIAAGGSDANTAAQARSKATPWAHIPGMANCNSSCAAYEPVAGDQFILRGGDTWTNSDFPVTWAWSGSSGSTIYIGVDQTWHSGASWTRPIWNAGGAVISTRNNFISFQSQSYVTLDNIEMTGFAWSGNPAYGNCQFMWLGGAQFITLENLYGHGWTHSGSGTGVPCTFLLGDTNFPYVNGSVLQASVIDGTDSTNGGDSLGVTYCFPSAQNNVIHNVSNAFLPCGHGVISGNLIYNVNADYSGNHGNAIETLSADSIGTFYIYNNVIHDSAGEAAFVGNSGETDYLWNNIWYNLTENAPELVQNITAGNAAYFWNNIIVAKSGGYCLRQGHAATTPLVVYQNNLCISTASQAVDPGMTATTITNSNNILMTPTTAATNQYGASQTPYVYSPTPINDPILGGAGANLRSSCNGPLVSLCTDTSYACTADSTYHVVCPQKAPISRPSNGAWDVGAYQLLQPPSGLRTTVQ